MKQTYLTPVCETIVLTSPQILAGSLEGDPVEEW